MRKPEDTALKMVRVGDALTRAGRVREAAAVYRRAAHAFDAEERTAHARAAWRLVLKLSPEDREARRRIVQLGGLAPAAPERRGFPTKVVTLDPQEIENTVLSPEMYEITDAGITDDAPEAAEHERTAPGQPVERRKKPRARTRPVGFLTMFDEDDAAGPERTLEAHASDFERTES